MHSFKRALGTALWCAALGIASEGPSLSAPAEPPPPPAATPAALPYSLPDAVADAMAGPLRLVGKGAWYGLSGSLACVYRNDRVLVVDEYCRPRELSSFGVTIVSPTRGRASIYAEGPRPVSKLERREYLIFSGRSESLDPRRSLSLEMSVSELSQYHAFAGRFVPFCDVSLRRDKKQGGCIKPLVALYPAYEAQNLGFIADPPASWFALVRDLIELRRRSPARMTDANRFAWGEAYAIAEEILLDRYHMSAANNREGLFAPVIAAPDGGLLLIGTRGRRALTVRLGPTGEVLWQRELSTRGFRELEGGSAVATQDGGFIVFVLAYVAANPSPRTRLAKLDGNGRVVWEWLGRGSGGLDTPMADSLKLSASGDIEMVGHIYVSHSPDPRASRRWQAGVDAHGKLLREEVGDPLPPPQSPPAK